MICNKYDNIISGGIFSLFLIYFNVIWLIFVTLCHLTGNFQHISAKQEISWFPRKFWVFTLDFENRNSWRKSGNRNSSTTWSKSKRVKPANKLITQQPDSTSMASLTKETRVMGHWNRDIVAAREFGVSKWWSKNSFFFV